MPGIISLLIALMINLNINGTDLINLVPAEGAENKTTAEKQDDDPGRGAAVRKDAETQNEPGNKVQSADECENVTQLAEQTDTIQNETQGNIAENTEDPETDEMPGTPDISGKVEITDISESAETAETVDISHIVNYAKQLILSNGYRLLEPGSHLGAWDSPYTVTVKTTDADIKKHIEDVLDFYKNRGTEAYEVWAESTEGGNFRLFIGYTTDAETVIQIKGGRIIDP